MALGDVLLVGHVTAGATALLLGPVAFLIGRGPHHLIALAYQVAVAAVALSAVVLAAFDFTELWWLIVLAVGTEGLALGGLYIEPGSARAGRVVRAHLLGGSYIALITALLVVSWESPLAWVLPSAIGIPAIVTYHERERLR